jgi:hypothetical protein
VLFRSDPARAYAGENAAIQKTDKP